MTPLREVSVTSPFGGAARHLQSLPTPFIAQLYKRKCEADISASFAGIEEVHLFECIQTGYRFWRPIDAAGNESFYQTLSASWPNYYRTTRWEYDQALKLATRAKNLVEIGCGRGFFLRAAEGVVDDAIGIELNRESITNKVTKFPIEQAELATLVLDKSGTFDVFCAFQVLEHLAQPDQLLEAALHSLASGGLLLLSTPNREFVHHAQQTDAFDLPPHHLGHFSEFVYRRLAEKYGLHVVSITKEPRSFEFGEVNDQTKRHFAFRSVCATMRPIMNLVFKITREAGPNIFVALRKP